MFELTNYITKRDRLQSILSSIRVVLSDFNLKSKEEAVKADFYRLNDEKFNLVVVGEFSRGKSTFVNALLGRRMLPVSKSPTTAVISKIIYGETSAYIVHYKSGESKTISEDEFLDIRAYSEEGVLSLDRLKDKLKSLVNHQENLDDIDFVEIRHPLPLCRNNVEVVDTPGTNDLNAGRVDITYNYLKKADAAILVLMATQALTKSEMEFLREQIIGNQVNDIFIVINGKDQCKTVDEQERIVKYVSDNLAAVMPHELKVFLVSSKQALTWRRKENGEKLPMSAAKFMPNSIGQTGFVPFEETMGKFLDDERGRVKLKKYISRAKGYLKAISGQIQAQYDAADHATDELKAQLAQLQPKVRKAKSESQRIVQSMETRLLAKETELVNTSRQAFTTMRQAATDVFNECNLNDSPEKIKHQIDVAITPIEKAFIENTAQLQNSWIHAEWNKALTDVKTIWDDLDLQDNANIRLLSQFDFSSNITSGVELSSAEGITGGDVAAGAVACALGFGWIVLGIAALGLVVTSQENSDRRKAMRKQLRTNFDSKYDSFNRSVVSRYKDHVSLTCRELQNAIDARLDDMEQSLSSIVQMKEASEGDATKIMTKLIEKKAVVERLNQELDEVMA